MPYDPAYTHGLYIDVLPVTGVQETKSIKVDASASHVQMVQYLKIPKDAVLRVRYTGIYRFSETDSVRDDVADVEIFIEEIR